LLIEFEVSEPKMQLFFCVHLFRNRRFARFCAYRFYTGEYSRVLNRLLKAANICKRWLFFASRSVAGFSP